VQSVLWARVVEPVVAGADAPAPLLRASSAVKGDWPLNAPIGPRQLSEVWQGKAAEPRGIGLMICIAWCADPVAMATKLGLDESDRYKATLLVLDAVRAGERVEIVGAAPCYIDLSGIPGFPQFVARMQPQLILRSLDALDVVPLADRDAYWLSSPSRDGKKIWETTPFLLVGAGAWDMDVASFPQPSMARYGRVGAPGSPWWILVERAGAPAAVDDR